MEQEKAYTNTITVNLVSLRTGHRNMSRCLYLSNPEHFNTRQCRFASTRFHISNAVFVETSVFAQGALVLPLRKRGFCNVHGPNVFYVPLDSASVECIT